MNNFNRIFFIYIIFFLFFSACQEVESSIKRPKIFSSDTILPLSLIMDKEIVLSDIGDNRTYHQATLIYGKDSMLVKVKTRGNFRRDVEICNFPPLMIQFDSLATKNTIFEGQKQLKVVTHCQQDSTAYEQMLLEEYAIYKMYNFLTDKSFKVQLAKITYKDLKKTSDSTTKMAFFIENDKKMAERLGEKLAKKKDTIQYLQCNTFLMTQTAVFQFMIGNTDWSISNKHNIELLKATQPIAIPYDFDLSGLIDASYATPTPELGIKTVRERLYRGYCQSDAELNLVFEKFKTHKDNIFAIWNDLPQHQTERKQKGQKYLENFYQIIENKDSIQFYFIDNCR
jgi:hypothetical protein